MIFLNYVYVNPVLPKYINFSPGACYVITKQNVLKYSKQFWVNMRSFVAWHKYPAEAHIIERALYTIFHCNFEVKNCMNNEGL